MHRSVGMQHSDLEGKIAIIESRVSSMESREVQRDTEFRKCMIALNRDVSTIKGMIITVGALSPFILWILNKIKF